MKGWIRECADFFIVMVIIVVVFAVGFGLGWVVKGAIPTVKVKDDHRVMVARW